MLKAYIVVNPFVVPEKFHIHGWCVWFSKKFQEIPYMTDPLFCIILLPWLVCSHVTEPNLKNPFYTENIKTTK